MISVHDLTKTFEGTRRQVEDRDGQSSFVNELVAVDRLSFQVSRGEVYGLLGPNGAGKTTTLRMILGLLRPTSGFAEVGGVRSDQEPDEVKRQIGLVSASAGLYQWLTPREMLLFFADLYGITPQLARTELERLISLLGLAEFIDQRGSTLSTGQKQRVLLARALIHRPPVLLLDEPTRGLDVFGTQTVFDYIRLLRDEGKAVIVSTHRLHEAQQLCDRFGLLHHGQLAMEGTLKELRQSTGQQSLADMFMRFAQQPELQTRTGGDE
jgi:sodium transport system ATP-binding protein